MHNRLIITQSATKNNKSWIKTHITVTFSNGACLRYKTTATSTEANDFTTEKKTFMYRDNTLEHFLQLTALDQSKTKFDKPDIYSLRVFIHYLGKMFLWQNVLNNWWSSMNSLCYLHLRKAIYGNGPMTCA